MCLSYSFKNVNLNFAEKQNITIIQKLESRPKNGMGGGGVKADPASQHCLFNNFLLYNSLVPMHLLN